MQAVFIFEKEVIKIINKKIITFFLIAIVVIIYTIKSCFKSEEISNKINFNEIIINEVDVKEKNYDIENTEIIKIHIIGEVNNPGLIELNVGSRIQDAIEKAGGLKPEADISKINLAYILSDGEKIKIPNQNDEELEDIEINNKNSKININTANIQELEKIPGVGESTANSIIEYRTKAGKFVSIDDIQNVSGIGENKFEKMKDYITVK